MATKWRVYIKPFDDYGEYAADWIEVTDDVDFNGMGSIAQDLDNTEYDIGVYRFSNFSLTLRNEHGRYSDVGSTQTIFHFTRSNSLCKVTWEIEENGPYAGLSDCGSTYLSEETEVIIGLLNDESLEMDLTDQKVKFKVLGRESSFLKAIVPFDELAAGDLISEVLYACLNQDSITRLLTVDPDNITVALDQELDSVAWFQNKTVQEAMNKLLLASNSVVFIQDGAVFVAPRTPGGSVTISFYGQASNEGPENIETIRKIKNGLSRMFNYITWKNATVVASDDSSLELYGARKKELDFEFYTDNTKRLNVLDAVLEEFKTPKQEFDLLTTLNYDTIAVHLLDRVSIDYPSIPVSDNPLPICGIAVAGEAMTPKMLWSFTISPDDHYKVIGRSIDLKNSTIFFRLRAI